MEISLIQQQILEIRGSRVMLDAHLAELYQVETRSLKQAVRRNRARFPEDFMFELSSTEIKQVVLQQVMPSKSYPGGASPMVFTEQGIAMLSSVLRGQKAVEVNIAIIRTFVMLRQCAMDSRKLEEKVEAMEARYDKNFEQVYRTLKYLISPQSKREPVGFKIGEQG